MNDESQDKDKLDDAQFAAVAATSSIIVFFAVYWIFQIRSMLELLELAYG